MRFANKLMAIATLMLISALSFCKENKDVAKPNVIIIYTNDQSAIDLNCFGATYLLPIPIEAMDSNPKLEQNQG